MVSDQFDSFVEDFLGEKLERSLLIVGASKIDVLLFSILSKYLLPKISGQKDDLLEGDQPIGTFSSRIKLSYRLGLIDKDIFSLLDQIRKIRNLSAHSLEFSIRKSPVKEHLAELRKGVMHRNSFQLVSTRFFNNELNSNIKELQCILVTLCTILQVIHEKVEQTKGNDITIRISGK